MKVLHINTRDIIGGAAKAAYRLHQSLLKTGVESKMLVSSKSSDDENILLPKRSDFQKFLVDYKYIIDKYPLKIRKIKLTDMYTNAVTGENIYSVIDQWNPDIVHFHLINRGYIKIEDIQKIKQPIVWTMHDMWSFTGGCHYNNNCENYLSHCGECPVLQSLKPNDLSSKQFNRKEKIYTTKKNISFIGPSKWIANLAKMSGLCRDMSVFNLPNTINTKEFQAIPKPIARQILNFDPDKRIVMFGAMDATSDKRKGFSYLLEAFKNTKESYILKVFGSSRPKNDLGLNQDIQYLGNFADELSLMILYSAADVVIVPSLQENLSNIILESLSCGTPVVAFNIGGNSDLIIHKENGYLASPLDSLDLANGIDWVLNDTKRLSLLSSNARNQAVTKFDYTIIGEAHAELYRKLLK